MEKKLREVPNPKLDDTRSSTLQSMRRPTSAPSREAIALRAYEKFYQRGCQHGFDQQDWFAAEQELTGANAPTVARA